MSTVLERIRRSLQTPAASSERRSTGLRLLGDEEKVGALPVRDAAELDRLVSEVLSETRTWPVVGLTARFLQDRAALDPATVRAIIGAEPPIYLICWRVTRRLQARLPRGLHVFGGAARIWWPLKDLPAESHPLIFDATGQYGAAALEDLAQKFDGTRPTASPAQRRAQTMRCAEGERCEEMPSRGVAG